MSSESRWCRGNVFAGPAKRRLGLVFALGGLLLLPLAQVSAESLLPHAPAAKSDKIKPELKTPARGTRVNVVADRITYNARTKTATAVGKVYITYGRYVLVATKVVYEQNTDRLTANGEVRLTEPGGNILEADIAQLQNKFRDGFAEHLRLLLTNDATLTAEYAKRSDGYLTVYQRVTYTRCKTCVLADGSPLWQIKSFEVTHNEDEARIYHKDATFEFLGVPVFWTPYLSHPDPTVKRASGFLIPSFEYSSEFGFAVETPYFWDIAPNMDVTFRPLITSEQGPLARATFRHRVAQGQYSVDAGGIYQLDTDLPAPGDRHFRGFVRTRGDFRINENWTWGWDGTISTDETFMRRYSIDNRTELTSLVQLTGIQGRNYFSAQALHFRGLLADDNNDTYPFAVPYIRHSYVLGRPVLGGELGFDTSMYSLYRNDPVHLYPEVNQGTQQTRAVFTAHWQRRMVGSIGTVVTPFAKLRSDLYYTKDLPSHTEPMGSGEEQVTARLLPTVGVDMRLPFVRSDSIGQHVLTPVTQLISASNEYDEEDFGNEDAINLNFDSTSLFLTDRFTGLDRFEGGTRANVGLLYTLLLPHGGFARASFGESFHLAGENSFVRNSGLEHQESDLVAGVSLAPVENLEFTYQARLEESDLSVRTQEAGIAFTLGPLITSANYVDVDKERAYGRLQREEQVWSTADLSLGWGWSLFGGLRYDLRRDEFVRGLGGIGYDCDCFAAKFFYKFDNTSDRDVEKNHSVMLSVEFKTLGSASVGTGL